MSTSKRNTRAALAQLFPASQGQREAPGLMLIERSRLTTAPQVRTDLESGIEELRQNIASMREKRLGIEGTGILQPLLASPDPEQAGHFRLIAGERRLRASEGVIDELPVVVVPHNAQAAPILQLIENLQRRSLSPLEEARGLQQLMGDQSLSIRDAAQLLGKPKSYLGDRLALLRMRPEVQAMVSERSDTMIHAREMEAVGDDTLRQSLIEAVIHEQISLAELRRRITAYKSHSAPPDAFSPDAAQPETPVLDDSAPKYPAGTSESEEVSERSDTSRSQPNLAGATSGISTSGTSEDESGLQQSEQGRAGKSLSFPQELKKTLGCLAQAERLLGSVSLTPARRSQAQRQLEDMEVRIARLKKILMAD